MAKAVEKRALDGFDKRELKLAITLLDPTFTGTKEDAAIHAGYARGNTVYDKLRQPHFCEGLQELHTELVRHTITTNAAKRQRILDNLYRRAMDKDTSPADVARVSETWGKFTGDIGTGGVSVNNSVTANAGSERDFSDRLRTLEDRKGITSKD